MLYRHGVTELENEAGEAFGEERLKTFLLQHLLSADRQMPLIFTHSLLETLNDFRRVKGTPWMIHDLFELAGSGTKLSTVCRLVFPFAHSVACHYDRCQAL